jgi:hypothetical protein
VTFYFFSGISIKVSGVDVGFVARVIRVSSEGVKKFLEVTFVRKNIHASQVDYIVVER